MTLHMIQETHAKIILKSQYFCFNFIIYIFLLLLLKIKKKKFKTDRLIIHLIMICVTFTYILCVLSFKRTK